MHFSEGGYDQVAQKLFKDLDVDAFYVSNTTLIVQNPKLTHGPQLEYDTERAGGLEPLRYMPLRKRVFLGLVTTKSGAVGHNSECLVAY